jgi:hypothetical protein
MEQRRAKYKFHKLNDKTRIGGVMDPGHTSRLAANQQDIARKIAKGRIGKTCLGRQQHQPPMTSIRLTMR